MPVKLTVGAQSSNKPAAPSPIPPTEEFPQKLSFPDGRDIWVSVPFPDKITIVGAVGPEHFLPAANDDGELLAYIQAWSRYIVLEGGKTTATVEKLNTKKQYYEKILLSVGSSGAKVHVSILQPTTKTPRWRLRLEMNPRLLGPNGLSHLAFDLRYGDTFRLDRFLASARCTRLDVAVDFINLAIWETVLHTPHAGKRVTYIGEDDELETVQLHKRASASKVQLDDEGQNIGVKTPLSPLGPLHARLYDRVKRLAYLLQPAPYGDVPVTRLELIRGWHGKGPLLQGLPGLKNPFEDYRLSYIADDGQAQRSWQAYVSGRRTRPKSAVSSELELGIRKSLAYGLRSQAPDSSLIIHGALWSAWDKGLAACGLGQWISDALNADF